MWSRWLELSRVRLQPRVRFPASKRSSLWSIRSHDVMVAYLFLTQDILVQFQMRPIIYCDTNGLSIMGHSGRINVGSNPSSRTEQLVEHIFDVIKRGASLYPRFRFESEHQNWREDAAHGAKTTHSVVV
jgi:hypothetical protein